MHWEIILHHCSGGSTQSAMSIESKSMMESPTGIFIAPDHEWDARLEFRLTVTDIGGLGR